MTVQFTEKDEGKSVVDINDARVGAIAVVTDGTAYMDFNDELERRSNPPFARNPSIEANPPWWSVC